MPDLAIFCQLSDALARRKAAVRAVSATTQEVKDAVNTVLESLNAETAAGTRGPRHHSQITWMTEAQRELSAKDPDQVRIWQICGMLEELLTAEEAAAQ